jgi:hypothetical protein
MVAAVKGEHVMAMGPIERVVDVSFSQALRCVEYRIPRQGELRRGAYLLSLGLRYGMVGVAAAHHLLTQAEPDEEPEILECLGQWPRHVEAHLRWEALDHLPIETTAAVPHIVSQYAQEAILHYVPLYRRLCPLDVALELVCEDYEQEFMPVIRDGWSWFRRRRAHETFRMFCRESRAYAMHFFERRQCNLEEVPEIALLGE